MNIPEELFYTNEHEWVRFEGDVVTVGLSFYAQDKLGDIVYVELPEEGEEVSRSDAFGVVESVKSVSDIYAPLSGKVVEVNSPLVESPEIINEDCYEEGWLLKIELSDASEKDELMDAAAYKDFIEEEES
jgi:glycine cleavage system H protein